MIKIRTQYDIDAKANSDATGLLCKDKSLTQQQFKDASDINVLFGKYLESGEIPQLENAGLAYGDFTGIFDFQSAMNAVRTAQGVFLQLPARIKNRFDNDPQKLLEFLNDPENREEARFLKLVKPNEKDNQPAAPTMAAGQPGTTVANPTGDAPKSPTGRGEKADKTA